MAAISRWFLSSGILVALALGVGCSSGQTGGDAGRGASAQPSSARAKGAREATEAIAAGKLKLKEYPPLPSPAYHGDYIRLLKERCGVDYEVPSLPKGVAEADFIEEIRGWNETMTAEIKRKFGDDILAQLHEESRKRWAERAKPKG